MSGFAVTAAFSPKKRSQQGPSSSGAGVAFATPTVGPAAGEKKTKSTNMVGWYVGKYSNDGIAWGLPFEEKVWCLLVEDLNRPSICYDFKQGLDIFIRKRHTALQRDQPGSEEAAVWPSTVDGLPELGMFLCDLSQQDVDLVGKVAFQKGLYINGDESDVMSAMVLMDLYVVDKMQTSEFQSVQKADRKIHIVNHTYIDMDDFMQNNKYGVYELSTAQVPAGLSFHILAAKPPGNRRALQLHLCQSEADGTDYVTMHITGNTYPFKCAQMTGQYYDKEGIPCEKGTPNSKWWDTVSHVELGTNLVELINTMFHYSAMKVKVQSSLSGKFQTLIEEMYTMRHFKM